MQSCVECHRLTCLLQESGIAYLAATNRYNTLLFTSLDKSWAAESLRQARVKHDERLRVFDRHLEEHGKPAQRMVAGS